MQAEYYLAINGRQEGPFSFEALRYKNLTADSLIWRTGLPDWVKASDLPELAGIIAIDVETDNIKESQPYNSYASEPPADEPVWFAMFGHNRVGPATISDLIARNLKPETPVWRNGMNDWAPASTQPELMERINPDYNQTYGQQPNFGQNPQYGQQPNFGQNPQYGQQPNFSQNPQYGQQPNFSQNPYNNYGQTPTPAGTNWMTWAIVATVVSFFCSCIGVIFGVIGIVQANNAKNLYQSGFDMEANKANNTAKTMTIIAFILAGIGLITSGFVLRNGLNSFNIF